MPCRDYDYPQTVEKTVENPETKRQLARVEALLCSTCRTLEQLVDRGVEFDFDTNPDLSKWWAAHKAEDNDRIVAEKRKRLEFEKTKLIADKPFKNLTAEDKRLLKKHGFL